MKKSLLALAVLGAMTGTAFAQSNVTIYGIADVGIARTKVSGGGASESVWSMDSGIWSGSRIGFKGSEDLGGGLSAIFTLENGFLADTGGIDQQGQLFGRQAWVGLNGGFGAVKFGRQYTPVFKAIDSVDPFETGLALGLGALAAFDPHGIRMNNTVNYSLPTNLGGFYGEVAYGFGEVAGDNSANRQIGFNVGYANGPVRAVVAYHSAKDATGDLENRSTFVGGTYDFRVAKLHAAFQDNKYEEVGGDEKVRSYMLGVSAPVSATGTVLASFQRADDRNSDAKMDVWAVGYTHGLSKRTHLYTSLGQAKEKETDIKATQFNVGMRHVF